MVYRDFPLRNHSEAAPAAEAAQCAHDQGEFWKYHDKIFANQRALNKEAYRKFAAEMNLDTEKFNTCLEAGTFKNDVVLDHRQGSQVGVTSTPTFFINGIMMVGARNVEAFSAIIDRELDRIAN